LLYEARVETGVLVLNYAEGPPNGPAFVHLHAGGARWQSSEGLLRALGGEWHGFAPDLRGHGRSGWEPPWNIATHLADVLAARYPALVRALIVGDAPLSLRNHATEEPTHRAQNELWHSLTGRPEPEIALALRETPVLDHATGRQTTAGELMGEDSPWFALQATSLHQLDPDMLAAVLAGPEVMLVDYDPEVLLPLIQCPVLLLQADPRQGNALPDADVELAMRLLARPTLVRLDAIGHPLHGPPGMTPRILAAMAPFLAAL
jgi:pimeloyl-ACP methyl ester carboxylesterase